ncbi:MAG: PEPxxWA-CTERM sorting domain-containing protein [Rubrivivax sp.]
MKPLLLPALALAAALPAAAQSSNFGNWTAYGDVLANATGATLSTASTAAGESPLSAASALLWYEIESALGVQFDADTYEGSAIVSSFSAAAGTRVDLGWVFNSDETDLGFADRAYVIVDGTVSTLAQLGLGAQSGSFSYTFASAGTHTLGFAVFDVNDVGVMSTLSLNGLTVTPAVPEPASIAMLLAGLGLVGAAARRRQATR